MFQWFERAASAGDRDALLDLAKCYLSGTGVRKSVQLALQHLAAAAKSDNITEAGPEEAEALLGSMRPHTL
jgi:TPR repeat protein